MSHLPPICPIGIAQHIIQRGNNRQICFGSEQVFFAYVGCLKEFSVKCRVDIHAWVLMTNHVHLLCTPHETGGLRVNLILF
jgi:putative transposase